MWWVEKVLWVGVFPPPIAVSKDIIELPLYLSSEPENVDKSTWNVLYDPEIIV